MRGLSVIIRIAREARKNVECLFVRRGMTGDVTIFYIAFSSAATYLEHDTPSLKTPDKSMFHYRHLGTHITQ